MRQRSFAPASFAALFTTALVPPLLALLCAPAAADPVADFYQGKSINIVIPTSPGGDYDRRARMVARHMGKHIPGNPTIVASNMPGGGGIVAANWLANIAPKDGSVLLMITQNLPVVQATGAQNIRFDVRRFNWLGLTTNTPNTVAAWHTSNIRSIKDAQERELIVGSTGVGSGSYYYPASMNALAGTRFKIVTGYPGGNDINLAMERGEVGGRGSNSWESWKSTRPQWLRDKLIHVLVQIGLKRHPELSDVPLMLELGRTEDDRNVLAFISADTAISRPIVTTPDAPRERVAALRRAFDATMKDPELLAEAQTSLMDITPESGEEAQKIATSIVDTPAGIVARAKALLGSK
jgi:tripartite-type tricarboxylate transporter receptor subunit TctC